jgi:hypothetical protein
MRKLARSSLIVTAFMLYLLAGAGSASADTDDIIAPSDPDNPTAESGWQAGTCTTDTPTCSVDTPTQFFEQAAGHPPVGFTQFIVKNEPPGQTPVGELKTVRVDLPPGLTVNPQATPQCAKAVFETLPLACPPGSEVGTSFATAALLGIPAPPLSATVYNIIPEDGEPARFGFNLAGNNVYLRADVAWEADYHEGFTIDVPPAPSLPPLLEGLILKNRLVFDGTSGNGTFITTPTTCFGPAVGTNRHLYSTWLRADSVEEPDPNFPHGSSYMESRIPPGTSPKECESIPFDPSLQADPNTGLTDSPAGAAVTVNLPEIEDPGKEGKQATSQVRTAAVSLPLWMGLNPSAANGLVACDDAQFGKGTRNPVACPAASKVGTVAVETPPLPEGSLTGDVYVGTQLDRDPASGRAYRIFVTAESARFGISARLLGRVVADPLTGQLTTSFDDEASGKVLARGLPQVPFSSLELDFNDGPRAPLTSPGSCGPHTATTQFVPWSTAPGAVPPGAEGGPSPDPPATPSDEFALSSAPGGGACPATLAARPFAPGFGAATANPKGGAFSPFRVDLTRNDGEQELKVTTVDLPPGLSAKLAGVKYCPEAALAAAATIAGAAEAASSSCPASSLVGTATVRAGSGPEPLQLGGKAFLAGPYKGAPLSLAIVTPATAGPFDFGSVVVRVALFVHRETAQVRAVSDSIPHVFGGALLDVRSVSIDLNRRQFSLNPTNCDPMAVAATLRGGGGNPADAAAFSSFAASAPFQVKNCEALGFKPKLFFRLFGATRRAKNPKLRAVLIANKGDANIGRAIVTLPRSLILDQSSIAKVCTRTQFAANDCPRNSVYGFARAFTPLLDDPLQGPVRLRSSDNELPDLVASLQGQIDVDLVGRIDSVKGRIRNSFRTVPDVPVSKFVLVIRGGKKGLLTNSRRLCGKGAGKIRAIARFRGHNGKKANQRPKLRRPCGKGKRGGKRKAR